MRGREDQVFGLKPDNFLQIHLRPVLGGVHDASSVGFAKSVSNERILADRNERAGPDNEENTTGRERLEPGVQRVKASPKVSSQRRTSFRDPEEVREFLSSGKDVVHIAGVGGVGRDAKGLECPDGLKA